MTSNDPITCFNGQECVYDDGAVKCPAYEYRTGLCQLESLKQLLKQLGGKAPENLAPKTRRTSDNTMENAPQQPPEPTEDEPNLSGIDWMTKDEGASASRKAESWDTKAYAFVFKYDSAKKQVTTFVKSEVQELVSYLKAHDNKYSDGIYDYSLSRDGNFLNRYLAKKR